MKCRLGKFKFDEVERRRRKKKKWLLSTWQKRLFSSKVGKWDKYFLLCHELYVWLEIKNTICYVRMHFCRQTISVWSANLCLMQKASVQHVVLTWAGWDLENVTSEPLHHRFSYILLFLHWVICTLHYILPLKLSQVYLRRAKSPIHFYFNDKYSALAKSLKIRRSFINTAIAHN